MLKIRRARYWSVHTHSRYSANDAVGKVSQIVERARELGYKGLALTDHGNIAGSVELYQECRKNGIKPFPGCEMYLVEDRSIKDTKTVKQKRYHFCVLAYTTEGYRNLVYLSTLSHQNFHNKPIVDLADLAALSESGRTKGLALTTGCYFGYVTQTLINSGPREAKRVVSALSGWFDVYVEIQRHRIEGQGEEWIAQELEKIADELNLPIVLGQDSHYIHDYQQPVHDTMKALVTWSDDPAEAVFPGDGFHLVDDNWMIDHHGQRLFDKAMEGHDSLLAKHDMFVPELETYAYRIPSIVNNPYGTLLAQTAIKLNEKFGDDPVYAERLQTEMDTIHISGMADYFLLVADVCAKMREMGVAYQTRGSAAGSLVAYLLGITNVDPIVWGTSFDRFMGRPVALVDGKPAVVDRKSPPDIDLDVDNLRRGEVIAWLNQRYSVIQIGNWSEMGFKTDAAGDQTSDSTGSVVVKYMSARRKKLLKEGHSKDEITELLEWRNIPSEDKVRMQLLSDVRPISGSGTHACGLILCNSQDELDSLVPKMWVPNSKVFVSQFDMDNVEAIGLVKLDLLGSKTMTVMDRSARDLGFDSVEDLKQNLMGDFDDKAVYKAMAAGETEGVFQLEGYSSMLGVKEMRPRTIHDVIAAMALFRPAARDAGATQEYLDRRKKRVEMPQRHKIIQDVVGPTYGVFLYQDQIIDILRAVGMNSDDLTLFLKAVKASNKGQAKAKKTIDKYLPMVHRMCAERGIGEEDIKWLEYSFAAATGYGFNKAHATVYGITAYLTQWLQVHHPDVFFANLLSVQTDPDDTVKYEAAARQRGVRILRADVNESAATDYQVPSPGVIRRPLSSVKGIGNVVAHFIQEAQPFKDFDDFMGRVNISKVTGVKDFKPGETSEDDLKGSLRALHDAKALGTIGGVPVGRTQSA